VLPEAVFAATGGLVSLIILWVAFSFIYLVMPNTRVRFYSALVGGIAGGTVWQVAQAIFIWFQGAATYYNVIYGALYHLLFLVIWIFWSWLIVLFGNEVAYAHQHLDRLSREFRRGPLPPEPVDEYVGLAALVSIAARFVQGRLPLSLEELGEVLPRGNNLAGRVIQQLQDCRLVLEVAPAHDGDSPRFIPGLSPDQITAAEVLQCLRQVRGQFLTRSLEEEHRMAELLQGPAESPAPPAWQNLSLLELVNLLEKKEELGPGD
jgi:membrane protein